MTCNHSVAEIVTMENGVISATGPSRARLWGHVFARLRSEYGRVDYVTLADEDAGPESLCGCRTPARVEVRILSPD